MLLSSDFIPARNPRLIPLTPHREALSIQCDVIFGSPGADCRGTGICKITGTNALSPVYRKQTCRATSAIAVRREEGRGISLIFFRSQLCIHLYRRHFWKGILKLDEPCALPPELRDSLQLDFQYVMPGRYSVCESEGCFRVDVDCA